MNSQDGDAWPTQHKQGRHSLILGCPCSSRHAEQDTDYGTHQVELAGLDRGNAAYYGYVPADEQLTSMQL